MRLMRLNAIAAGAAALALMPTLGNSQDFPNNIKPYPSGELCTLYALSLITGEAPIAASVSDIVAELRERGEDCAPAETYFTAARERANRMAEADAIARGAEIQERARQEEGQQWRRRALFEIGTQLLSTPTAPPPPAPTTTTCRPDGIGGVTCTSW